MTKLNPNIFMIAALIGAAGIIILKLLDMSQFFVTACPISIMLVYACYHYIKHQSQLSKVGDNLYYLGFLYTLVSLAMSLFEFSSSDEAVETIAPIITNFGIAIFSTIFGIAFRVFFDLMQKDPEDTVSDFSDTVRKLSKGVSDLDYELRKFSSFRIELQQILREAGERQKKAITQFKSSVTRFTKTVEEGRDQFQVNLDSFVNTVSGLNERVSNLNSVVNSSSDAVAASLEDLVEKINRMDVPKDLLEQLLRPSVQSIETGAEQVNASSDALSASVRDLVEKINKMDVPKDLLERLLQSPIQQFQVNLDSFGQTVSDFNAQVSNLDSAIKSNSEAVSASVSDLVGRINNIQTSEDFIATLLQQSETSTKRTADEQRPADGKL